MTNLMEIFEKSYLKNEVTELHIGDLVRVHQKIIEGNKERIQVFQGTVIKMQNTGISKSFTVRKVSFSIGVEKTFLFHSPRITKIQVVKQSKIRRSKLYYLRELSAKSARLQEKTT